MALATWAAVAVPRNLSTAATTCMRRTVPYGPRDVDEATFLDFAQKAKDTCPVSKLFAGGSAEITMDATLA